MNLGGLSILLEILRSFMEPIIKCIEAILNYFKSKDADTSEEGNRRGGTQEKYKAILYMSLFFLVCIISAFYLKGSFNFIETEEKNSKAEEMSSHSEDIITDEPKSNNGSEKVYNFNGGTYRGSVDEEGIPNGQGKMEYFNGDVYNGHWNHGVREGMGSITYSNGDTYNGEWKDGKRDGSGTYTWGNGGKYIGEYKADLRNGEGSYIGWTGFVDAYGYGYEGNYYGNSENDKFQGEGRFEFDNGDVFEGYFNANELWNGIYTMENGSEYRIENGEPKK